MNSMIKNRKLHCVEAEEGSIQTPYPYKDTSHIMDNSKELRTMSRGRILKNLIVISIFYCLFYTGFWSLSNLQSTMNATSGMGPYSQAVIYGFSMLSCLFLPELVIDRFGCKKVLAVTTFLCLPYIAANMYLRWDILIVSSVLYGLASGPFSSALKVYIGEIAKRFQETVTEDVEFVMACFFGFYTFFMENTQVWGNVISSLVLRQGKNIPQIANASFSAKLWH
ncbi:UNC93-like protein [Trichonephila clavata]|uniref:UNC93-like protein n=1 Tax=Trichonephila clavata TaxID=2740835 RepID=A0A8X6FJ84_TRICU|nr:UNC93-like protein [Trichonephila clavata]